MKYLNTQISTTLAGAVPSVGVRAQPRLIRPLGQGSFDVGNFVRTVRAAGYAGPFGQICWGIQGSAPEYLESSMAAWKSLDSMGT